jgi:hypothetical protein
MSLTNTALESTNIEIQDQTLREKQSIDSQAISKKREGFLIKIVPTIENIDVIIICQQCLKENWELSWFYKDILEKFEECLIQKKIILEKNTRNLIIKRLNILYSRLFANINRMEFEKISTWNVYGEIKGREMDNSRKPYCWAFREWFINGNFDIAEFEIKLAESKK